MRPFWSWLGKFPPSPSSSALRGRKKTRRHKRTYFYPRLERLEERLVLFGPPTDNIQVFVYQDIHNTGVPEADDPRVPGVNVTLNVNGKDELTLATDSNGRSWFGPGWGNGAMIQINMAPTKDSGDGTPYHYFFGLSKDYITSEGPNNFTFTNPETLREIYIPQDYGIAAYDSDTFLDGNEGFYFGIKSQDHLVVTTQPASAVLNGSQFDVKVTAEDANNNPDPNFTGSVTVALSNNPGSATLGGTLTEQAQNGVADFGDLTLDEIGKGYTLEATSGNLPSAMSGPIDVKDKLVVTTQPPNSVLANKEFDVKISAEDANGDVDSNFTNNVTMALANDPNGNSTLGGTLTKAAAEGVADFSDLTIDKAGQGFTLKATSDGQDSATTNLFDVVAITATSISFNTDQGGVDYSYTVSGGAVPEDTPVALYWASGQTFDDELGKIAGTDNPVPAGTGPGTYSQHVDMSLFQIQNPPSGAKDILLVVGDPESDNFDPIQDIKSLDVPDISATSLDWHENSSDGGGVDINYDISNASLPAPATISLYWVHGDNFDRSNVANYSLAYQTQSGTNPGSYDIPVPAASLTNIPDGTGNADNDLNLFLVVDAPTSENVRGNIIESDWTNDVDNLDSSPQAIVSVTATGDGTPDITATFTPANGALTLDQAESICGVNHFNWVQTMNLPDNWQMKVGSSPNATANSLTDPTLPLYDPIVRPAGTQITYFVIFNGDSTDAVPITINCDQYPPYLDEIPVNYPVPEWKTYGVAGGTEDPFTFIFHDQPKVPTGPYGAPYNLNDGNWDFTTKLVGMTKDSQVVPLSDIPDTTIDWSDNAVYDGSKLAGGVLAIVVTKPPPDFNPPIISGGVTNIVVGPLTVTPTFIGLSAPAITYGTATTTISGQLNSNVTGQTIPAGETVQVTLNGVTQNAALDSNDNFSTTFNTSTLGASGSPYTIDFNYAGDATFSAATGSSTLTVNPIHTTFTVGDVFVSIGNGQVQWRLPDGTINETLDTGLGSGIYTAGMAFDSANNLYVTDFNGQAVSEFNDHGVLLGTFGSGYNSDPESILIDSSGNIYVGQADSSRQVLKFDPTGKLLASYSPQTEDRGTDWIDLASDQHTLYYTSEGTSIKRFDVATNTQLPDLATNLPGGSAYAHRLLSDGTTLVANSSEVVRLDASGNIIQTYAPPGGGSTLFGLNLDPDGTSFWTADLANSNVYKFDIATGKLLESYNGGSGTTVAGLAVFGELTAARSADVVLTQSVSPNTSVSVGTNLTYTLTVTNNGPDKSSAVSLQDTLPSNTSFVSATGTYTLANGVVTWNLGDLAANGNVSVTLVVNTTAVGTADNEAVVSSNTPDPDKSNNTSGLQTSVVNQQATITGVSITWGSQTAALQTASDGVRLLPAGRQTDIPWVNVQQITITLSTAASLGSGDISVSGQVAGNYGPVTLSGSGTQYTITLAKPISAADLVTVTIGNASIASYTRRMDVLPGDINDDGVVNVTDGTFILKNPTPAHPYNVFYDMNGDGAVNTTDFNLYRPYIGTVLPTLDAQLATGTLTAGGVSNLTSSELAPVLAAAIREWASAGLPAAEVARLRGITAQVANLPAGYLGEAVLDGNTIYLSPNAAGYGWYINTASSSFAAIGRRLAPTEFLASPPSPASGHEDLLTVVMHELGHTLGLGDLNPSLVPADLMAETLATGVRRLPSRQDVAWVSAHAAAATLAASANTMSAADVVFARIGNRASSSAPAAVFPPSSAGSLTQLARTSLLFSLFPAASLLDKTLDERPGAYPAVAAAPVIPIGRASFLQMALGFLGSDPWKQSNSWTTDSSAAEV